MLGNYILAESKSNGEEQINNEADNQRPEADSAESKAPDAEKEINLLCQVAIEKLEKMDADANKQKSEIRNHSTFSQVP